MQTVALTSDSLDDLNSIAQEVIDQRGEKQIILFQGDLGAGKTTLIKRLCALLGIEDEVSSPTFSLVNEYLSSDNKVIYHFDFYRIKDVSEAFDMGVDEYFDSGNLCLVEWPEMIEGILPEQYLLIKITLNGSQREYSLIHEN